MLKIFNDLKPFFEDCYKEIAIREYSRLNKVSPPTSSSLLKELEKENLLISKKDRNLILYRANRTNSLFIDISKAYWRIKLSSFIDFLKEEVNFETIILFGSVIKGETTLDSDIDIFINSKNKDISINSYENKLKRKIQLHFKEELKNTNLKKNIQTGLVLNGTMI